MTMPADRTILKTVTRLLPNRCYIVAQVGLQKLDGNAQAYWTATADVYEPHGTWSGKARHNNGREADMGGACHTEILRAFPKLAPIVALHLSDPDGVPMHALANGRYHLAQGNREAAARLWRCPVSALPAVEDVESFLAADIEGFVDAQRERWAREAGEAWTLLEGLT